MIFRRPCLVLLGFALVFAANVEAEVRASTRRYELHIDPVKQRVYICDLCDTRSERIISENRIKPETVVTFDPGDEMDLIIENANPVVFTYKFGGVEAFKNSDAANLEKFFASVKAALPLFPSPDTASVPELIDIFASVNSVPRATAQARVNANVSKARIDVAATAEDKLLKAGFNDTFFDDLDADIRRVRELIDTLPRLTNETVTPAPLKAALLPEHQEKTLANSWSNVKAEIASWNLESLATELKTAFKKLEEAPVAVQDTGAISLKIDRYSARSRAVGEGLATLVRFSGWGDALGRRVLILDEDGKPVVLDYDTINDRRYTVKIAVRTEAEGLPKDTRDKIAGNTASQAGDFRILDQPYHPIHILGGGPAFVYNLLKTPQYVAEKAGEELVIKKKGADRVTGQDVAAMLNVIPAGWDDPFFTWAFQLGVTPKKDNFAAYLGTGALFRKYFFIGGGLVVQQADRLAPGLEIGQVVASADELKLKKEYRTGAYIHFTVNIGK